MERKKERRNSGWCKWITLAPLHCAWGTVGLPQNPVLCSICRRLLFLKMCAGLPTTTWNRELKKKKQYKTSKQRHFNFDGANNIFGFVFFSFLTWIQNKEAEEKICAKCQEWNVGHKHWRICYQDGWHFYLLLEGFSVL